MSNPLKMPPFFGRFRPPSRGSKIIIFEENRVQEASWRPSESVLQEKSKKRRQTELKKTIFSACAGKDTYHACASRPSIYSVSWLSDVCCYVDTCVQPEVHVGPSWRPEMEPKMAPYGLQDGLKTDPEAILKGFDVRSFKRTIKAVCPKRATDLYPPNLGPWGQGREGGKPPSHADGLYYCILLYMNETGSTKDGPSKPPVARGGWDFVVFCCSGK